MDEIFKALADYGIVGIMTGIILFLLKDPILEMVRSGSGDTDRLVRALREHSDAMNKFGEGLNEMADQFQHNNSMFTGVSRTALEMVTELRAIKDEIIRNSK